MSLNSKPTNKTPDIKFSIGPSGSCPVQAEGTINGKRFYFRARKSTMQLFIGNTKSAIPKAGGVMLEKPYKGEEGMAGHACPNECRDFIWKHAGEALSLQASQEMAM
jgi:hypothetical protein